MNASPFYMIFFHPTFGPSTKDCYTREEFIARWQDSGVHSWALLVESATGEVLAREVRKEDAK